MLLIHPPVAKVSEPPVGIAVLAGVLERAGVACSVLDLNLLGLEGLIRGPVSGEDVWTRRALRHRDENLRAIRHRGTYTDLDRYTRVVMDLNRLVERSTVNTSAPGRRISLANYLDEGLAPTRSQDLLRAAESPDANPFVPILATQLTRTMETAQPTAVGFSLNYLSQALCTFALIGFIRRSWPDVVIILGGGLVTSWAGRLRSGDDIFRGNPSQPRWNHGERPAGSKANPSGCFDTKIFGGLVNTLIAGPGEAGLLQLVDSRSPEKGGHGLPKYAGFAFDDYFAPGRILPYAASRGCYWNRCAFCPEPAEGNRFIPMGHRHVVRDLRVLSELHHPALIHMVDNAISPALLDALIQEPPGAPWYGFVRFSRRLTDPDFCRALRRAGCVMLKLGLESGSQSVLDQEGKGVELALAEAGLKSLKSAGIASYVYLLFGTPSESVVEARTTLALTARLSNEIDFLNVAVFNLPLTGRARADVETLPHADDLSLYASFRHPKGWDRRAVRRFLDREFRRHPAIAAILRRDPPLFTSNHAPFFVRGLGAE
ncbi:MAG: radical SAM protein [Desulfovibrionales bacterium]|nr:MAG: radical SAM protein [Desulfovibrionales bacterium]